MRKMNWTMREGRFGAGLGIRLVAGLRIHWRLATAGALLLAIAALGAALLAGSHGSHSAAAVVPYPHDLAQVSFAVAGDVIPHEAVRAAAAADGDGASLVPGQRHSRGDLALER